MSSANLVEVIYVEETTYGEKPSPLSSVTCETAIFTSESLSGTPEVAESAAIRTDRMSGGQNVTGLTVEGDLNFELASGKFFKDFFRFAMMNDYVPVASIAASVTLTPDGSDDQLATLSIDTGDLNSIGAGPGVILQLVPSSGSPVNVSVISVSTATSAQVATRKGEDAISAVAMSVEVPAHLDIGKLKPSFLLGKAYTDVTHLQTTDEHSQTYLGGLVSGFTLDADRSGSSPAVTGAFQTVGNGYEQEVPSFSQQVEAAGGTIAPPDDTQPLNPSSDVPLVTSDLAATDFCIERLGIEVSNGLSPQLCIGKQAPTDYTLGRCTINITADVYLSDTSYDAWMAGKLTQIPVAISTTYINRDGGWSFVLPQVQLSFPDPASTGVDEQTMINGSGTAKVGANGESAIRIYQLVGDQ